MTLDLPAFPAEIPPDAALKSPTTTGKNVFCISDEHQRALKPQKKCVQIVDACPWVSCTLLFSALSTYKNQPGP